MGKSENTSAMAVYTLPLFAYVLGALLVSVAAQAEFGQCGGTGWEGDTACPSGWVCTALHPSYSQCLQDASTVTSRSITPETDALESVAAGPPTVGPSHRVSKLPALGWNSWNAYHCDIDETKIMNAAKQFVSLGLAHAGYNYISIDDCWPFRDRDAYTGRIVPDPQKFPDGIKGVAKKVHDLGLKLGVYSDAGTHTCAGFPGSLGRENLDARTFADWGVDYLKYDNCNVPQNWTDASKPPGGDWYNSNSAVRYRQMAAALDQAGRPFHFSLCIWGKANVWDWGGRVGHSWRMADDASPTWSYITSIIATNAQHLNSVNFYSHNDMDMMEIGNGNLTVQEQRTHFAAWVFLKSPILLGTDLSKLSSAQLKIIKNAELLAFHQDATVGEPATPFEPTKGAGIPSLPEFYAGKSSKGTHVFILNPHSTTNKTFHFSSVPGLGAGPFVVHDMWTGKDVGTYKTSYTTKVNAHDTAALFLKHA